MITGSEVMRFDPVNWISLSCRSIIGPVAITLRFSSLTFEIWRMTIEFAVRMLQIWRMTIEFAGLTLGNWQILTAPGALRFDNQQMIVGFLRLRPGYPGYG
jgi:hypothetical protein